MLIEGTKNYCFQNPYMNSMDKLCGNSQLMTEENISTIV